jgi:hypothetical protein
MPKSGTSGSVRGAASDGRPYRDPSTLPHPPAQHAVPGDRLDAPSGAPAPVLRAGHRSMLQLVLTDPGV